MTVEFEVKVLRLLERTAAALEKLAAVAEEAGEAEKEGSGETAQPD